MESTGSSFREDRYRKQSETEIRIEKFLALTEEGLVYDGVKINSCINQIKQSLEEARKNPEKKYHRMYHFDNMNTIEEIENEEKILEEKKKQWETDITDFLHEKTLRELGKGKELDEKTSLMFDKMIRLVSEKVKNGYRMHILTEQTFTNEPIELLNLYQMRIQDLEKEARRKAAGKIYQNLPKEEMDEYDEFYKKIFEDLKTKVQQRSNEK